MDDKLLKLYNTLVSDNYDLPEFNQFKSDMTDNNKLSKLYGNIFSEYDLPEFSQFQLDMFPPVKKKEETQPSSVNLQPSSEEEVFSSQQVSGEVQKPQKVVGSESVNGESVSSKTKDNQVLQKVDESIYQKENEELQSKFSEYSNLIGTDPKQNLRDIGLSRMKVKQMEDKSNEFKWQTPEVKQELNKEKEKLKELESVDKKLNTEVPIIIDKLKASDAKLKEAKLNNRASDIEANYKFKPGKERVEGSFTKAGQESTLNELDEILYGNPDFYDSREWFSSGQGKVDLAEVAKASGLDNVSPEDIKFLAKKIEEKNISDYITPIKNDIAKSGDVENNVAKLLIPELSADNTELIQTNLKLEKAIQEKSEAKDPASLLEKEAEIKKLKALRDSQAGNSDSYVDINGNIVSKEDDAYDKASTSIYRRTQDELSKRYEGVSDMSELTNKIVDLKLQKDFLEKKKKEIQGKLSNTTLTYKHSNLDNKLRTINNQLQASIGFYAKRQNPENVKGNFFTSFADVFTSMLDEDIIVTEKEKAQALASGAGDIVMTPELEERIKGNFGENAGSMVGEGVKMIAESALVFGAANKVMTAAKFAERYAKGVNIVANSFKNAPKLNKYAQETAKVLKYAAPYVESAATWKIAEVGMPGLSTAGSIGETAVEQLAKKFPIMNQPLLKWIFNTAAIGTSETAGSLLDNMVNNGEFDISTEELVMNYAMGAAISFAGGGNIGSSQLETEILALDVDNVKIKSAQEFIKAKRNLEENGSKEEVDVSKIIKDVVDSFPSTKETKEAMVNKESGEVDFGLKFSVEQQAVEETKKLNEDDAKAIKKGKVTDNTKDVVKSRREVGLPLDSEMSKAETIIKKEEKDTKTKELVDKLDSEEELTTEDIDFISENEDDFSYIINNETVDTKIKEINRKREEELNTITDKETGETLRSDKEIEKEINERYDNQVNELESLKDVNIEEVSKKIENEEELTPAEEEWLLEAKDDGGDGFSMVVKYNPELDAATKKFKEKIKEVKTKERAKAKERLEDLKTKNKEYKKKVKERAEAKSKQKLSDLKEKMNNTSNTIEDRRKSLYDYTMTNIRSGALDEMGVKGFKGVLSRMRDKNTTPLQLQKDLEYVSKTGHELNNKKVKSIFNDTISKAKTERTKNTTKSKESSNSATAGINLLKTNVEAGGKDGADKINLEPEDKNKKLSEYEEELDSILSDESKTEKEKTMASNAWASKVMALEIMENISKANKLEQEIRVKQLELEKKQKRISENKPGLSKKENKSKAENRAKELADIDALIEIEKSYRNNANVLTKDLIKEGRSAKIAELAKKKEKQLEVVQKIRTGIQGSNRLRDKIRGWFNIENDLDVFVSHDGNYKKNKRQQLPAAKRMIELIIDGKFVEWAKSIKNNTDRFDGLLEEMAASSRDLNAYVKSEIINPIHKSRINEIELHSELNELLGDVAYEAFGKKIGKPRVPASFFRPDSRLSYGKPNFKTKTTNKYLKENIDNLSPSQAVYIHLLAKDPSTKKRLEDYHGFTSEIFTKLESDLKKDFSKELKYGELLQSKVFPKIYNDAKPVYERTTGIILPDNANYVPVAGVKSSQKAISTGDANNSYSSKNVDAGHFMERTGREIDWRKGISNVAGNYMETMVHYTAFEEAIKNTSEIFSHKDIKNALDNIEPGMYRKINTHLARIANNGGDSKNSYVRGANKIKNRFTKSTLGLNPKSGMSQVLSSLNGMVGENPIEYMKQASKVKQNLQSFKYLFNDPVFQSRFKGGFDNDTKSRFDKALNSSNDLNDFYRKLTDAQMVTTKIGDIFGALSGVVPKFGLELERQTKAFESKNNRKPNSKELEGLKKNARDYVYYQVERVQQTPNIEGMSLVQGDGGIGELLTTFQSSQIQYQQEIRSAFRNLKRYGLFETDINGNLKLNEKGKKRYKIDKRAYEDIAKIAMYGVIQPSMYALFSQGIDLEEDDWKLAALRSTEAISGLDGIPIMTGILDNILSKQIGDNFDFDLGVIPAYDAIMGSYNDLNEAYGLNPKTERGRISKEKAIEKASIKLLSPILMLNLKSLKLLTKDNYERWNDEEKNDWREYAGWHPMSLEWIKQEKEDAKKRGKSTYTKGRSDKSRSKARVGKKR